MQITHAAAAALVALSSTHTAAETAEQERLWQATAEVRKQYFETAVGPLPNDILKMLSMTGVWPGGGLYVIPAPRLGAGMAVYTTFGLSNPDMPTTVAATGSPATLEGITLTLARKSPAPKRPDAAGYGYEIIVVAQAGLDWPLNALQWAVHAELARDMDFLGRVERHHGLTIEKLDVGTGKPINVLISKALPPLPIGTRLPAGKMEVLVITTISESDMQWSMRHGRDKLLRTLQASGKGQVSR